MNVGNTPPGYDSSQQISHVTRDEYELVGKMRSGMKSSQLKSPVFKIQIASCFNSPRVELVLRFERLLSPADNGQTTCISAGL